MIEKFLWRFKPTNDRQWTIFDDALAVVQYTPPPKIWVTAIFKPGSVANGTTLSLTLVQICRTSDGSVVRAPNNPKVYAPLADPYHTNEILKFDIDTPAPTSADGYGRFIFVLELIKEDTVLAKAESREFEVIELLRD
jgi:hypothetical protein